MRAFQQISLGGPVLNFSRHQEISLCEFLAPSSTNMKRLLKESNPVAQTVASSAPCFGPLNSGPPSFPSSALLANPSPAFHAVSGCLMFSTTDHLCRFLCGGFPWNLPPRGQLVLSHRWTSWKALRYLSTALRRGRLTHTTLCCCSP